VNSFWTYFFLFAIWGHVMVAMAFLLSVLFQRERSAAGKRSLLFCLAVTSLWLIFCPQHSVTL
jgi:uncharacterized membrane protein